MSLFFIKFKKLKKKKLFLKRNEPGQKIKELWPLPLSGPRGKKKAKWRERVLEGTFYMWHIQSFFITLRKILLFDITLVSRRGQKSILSQSTKKKPLKLKIYILLINRYAIGKRNLEILWRNCENEQDYYSNYIHLI